MNIVITGASSGIGKTVATYLASKGHRVIGTSRNQEGLFENFELVKLDVTSDDSVENFTKNVFHKISTIDVLINNAGFCVSGPIESISIEETKTQIDTNYLGVVRVTQKFLPHFRARNFGYILNISSMAGLIGMPFQAHYSASKFALEGFTEALRLELSPFNIKVCNINPGDFKTNFTTNRKISKTITPAYQTKFEQVLSIYENDEKNGSDPILIAKLIDGLIKKKNLKIRYIVGKPSQTIAISLKRIFGARFFETMLKRIWKIKD